MSDPTLRRTIRRCTAAVLIPLSLYPIIPIARLDDDGVAYTHPVLSFADEIALLVFLGALAYLVGSVGVQVVRNPDERVEASATADER
jgi:hypothetical protein